MPRTTAPASVYSGMGWSRTPHACVVRLRECRPSGRSRRTTRLAVKVGQLQGPPHPGRAARVRRHSRPARSRRHPSGRVRACYPRRRSRESQHEPPDDARGTVDRLWEPAGVPVDILRQDTGHRNAGGRSRFAASILGAVTGTRLRGAAPRTMGNGVHSTFVITPLAPLIVSRRGRVEPQLDPTIGARIGVGGSSHIAGYRTLRWRGFGAFDEVGEHDHCVVVAAARKMSVRRKADRSDRRGLGAVGVGPETLLEVTREPWPRSRQRRRRTPAAATTRRVQPLAGASELSRPSDSSRERGATSAKVREPHRAAVLVGQLEVGGLVALLDHGGSRRNPTARQTAGRATCDRRRSVPLEAAQ